MKTKHIRRWRLPENYAGPEWPEYFVSAGRHRDSEPLDESNFFVTLRRLGGESKTVKIVREWHWAVGWVEWIAVHESDKRALRIADQCEADIDDHLVLDYEDFDERSNEH